jgi:hypothetical protein
MNSHEVKASLVWLSFPRNQHVVWEKSAYLHIAALLKATEMVYVPFNADSLKRSPYWGEDDGCSAEEEYNHLLWDMKMTMFTKTIGFKPETDVYGTYPHSLFLLRSIFILILLSHGRLGVTSVVSSLYNFRLKLCAHFQSCVLHVSSLMSFLIL